MIKEHFRRKGDWVFLGTFITLLGVIWAALGWGAVVVGKHKAWMIKVDEALELKPKVEMHDKAIAEINGKLDVILAGFGLRYVKK